jgi:hypothetical protein
LITQSLVVEEAAVIAPQTALAVEEAVEVLQGKS